MGSEAGHEPQSLSMRDPAKQAMQVLGPGERGRERGRHLPPIRVSDLTLHFCSKTRNFSSHIGVEWYLVKNFFNIF